MDTPSGFVQESVVQTSGGSAESAKLLSSFEAHLAAARAELADRPRVLPAAGRFCLAVGTA